MWHEDCLLHSVLNLSDPLAGIYSNKTQSLTASWHTWTPAPCAGSLLTLRNAHHQGPTAPLHQLWRCEKSLLIIVVNAAGGGKFCPYLLLLIVFVCQSSGSQSGESVQTVCRSTAYAYRRGRGVLGSSSQKGPIKDPLPSSLDLF